MIKADSYAEGYNQGFDDYKAGKKRHPHSLKNLSKMVMMRSQDVERYVQAYHQGYEAAVRKYRLQRESRQPNPQQQENPEEQTNRRLKRLRSLRKKPNRGGPDREL